MISKVKKSMAFLLSVVMGMTSLGGTGACDTLISEKLILWSF